MLLTKSFVFLFRIFLQEIGEFEQQLQFYLRTSRLWAQRINFPRSAGPRLKKSEHDNIQVRLDPIWEIWEDSETKKLRKVMPHLLDRTGRPKLFKHKLYLDLPENRRSNISGGRGERHSPNLSFKTWPSVLSLGDRTRCRYRHLSRDRLHDCRPCFRRR